MADITPKPKPKPEERLNYTELRRALQAIGFKVHKRSLQSSNFVASTTGWQLTAGGVLQAVNVVLSGEINATTGSIGGFTIGASTLTGGTIQTAATGVRIVISSSNNFIGFYDGSTKVCEINGNDVTGSIVKLFTKVYRPGQSTESIEVRMRSNATGGAQEDQLYLRVGGLAGIFGVDIRYTDAGGVGLVDFNARIESDFDPDDGGGRDMGNASQYWGDINYKTLTDRGCIGWYDKGVEMLDGEVVSDLEALKRIKKHPTFKTPTGRPRLDYRTMPKDVYKPADEKLPDGTRRLLPRDEKDRPYFLDKKGKKKHAQDGAETTALIGILIGAIKEAEARISKLEEKVDAQQILIDNIINK